MAAVRDLFVRAMHTPSRRGRGFFDMAIRASSFEKYLAEKILGGYPYRCRRYFLLFLLLTVSNSLFATSQSEAERILSSAFKAHKYVTLRHSSTVVSKFGKLQTYENYQTVIGKSGCSKKTRLKSPSVIVVRCNKTEKIYEGAKKISQSTLDETTEATGMSDTAVLLRTHQISRVIDKGGRTSIVFTPIASNLTAQTLTYIIERSTLKIVGIRLARSENEYIEIENSEETRVGTILPISSKLKFFQAGTLLGEVATTFSDIKIDSEVANSEFEF